VTLSMHGGLKHRASPEVPAEPSTNHLPRGLFVDSGAIVANFTRMMHASEAIVQLLLALPTAGPTNHPGPDMQKSGRNSSGS
jgi:hypothetical protein